jgi:hypothetical protein
MSPGSILTAIALAATVGACAASERAMSAAAGPPAETVPPLDALSCPLGVDGARVEITDVDGGVEMTFTSMARIEELRERTRRAADLHGPGAQQGVGHRGRHRQGEMAHHGLQAFAFPPARITVQDVELGARLQMSAVFPSDVERIRARARERAEAMMACR